MSQNTPSRPVRALIAEDEPLLREQLKYRLQQAWPELEVVAEAENGRDAVALFEQHQPDLAFLDIHMPVMTGIEVARQLSGRCHVVFVTAYDQYAIEAFNHGAVDYVLKPVNAERLATALDRLKERLAPPMAAPEPIDRLLAALTERIGNRLGIEPSPEISGGPYLKWIKASLGQNLRLIAVPDVCYFQAEDKYTKVVTVDTEALIKKPIKELHDELDPELFWQVHRATIVNVNFIASVGRDYRDQPLIRLKNRVETLTVSRAYAHLFKQM